MYTYDNFMGKFYSDGYVQKHPVILLQTRHATTLCLFYSHTMSKCASYEMQRVLNIICRCTGYSSVQILKNVSCGLLLHFWTFLIRLASYARFFAHQNHFWRPRKIHSSAACGKLLADLCIMLLSWDSSATLRFRSREPVPAN